MWILWRPEALAAKREHLIPTGDSINYVLTFPRQKHASDSPTAAFP